MAENQSNQKPDSKDANIGDVRPHKRKKLSADAYEKKLEKLHLELVKMQYWIKNAGNAGRTHLRRAGCRGQGRDH